MDRGVALDGHDPTLQQTSWRRTAAPVAKLRPGERLRVRVPDSSSGQLTPRSRGIDLASLDMTRVDAAVGPIEIVGARAGDRLDVSIRRLRTGPWGWSGVFRDFGLLRDRFDDDLQHWTLGPRSARPAGGFLPDVRIPTRPMLGWVGLAPAEGTHPMIPPRRSGGNLDHRLVGVGATLSLPVEVDGALLSLGDPHAAQGDGEVSGTGIETSAEVELDVALRPGRAPPMPFLTANRPVAHAGPVVAGLGIGPDLHLAAVSALEGLLAGLEDRGIPAKAGYVLASVAGELRISEAVDMPNFVVSASYPIRLLPGRTGVKSRRTSPPRKGSRR